MLRTAALTEVKLEPLLRGMLETYPNLQPDKADIALDGPLPAVVGNEGLLTQCFSNLLDNAVKFVAPGVRPHVRIWCEPARPGANVPGTASTSPVRIFIQDNGIGLQAAAQPPIFRMFQRDTHEYEGTGLGLAIVRKVVERMGGAVGFESEPGKGTRFWIELRRAGINTKEGSAARGQ